jgi:IS1 family transposase
MGMETKSGNQIQEKLDNVWQEVTRNVATDFLKRAITPETTLSELKSILSYDKVSAVVSDNEVVIGELMKASKVSVSGETATVPTYQRRIRSLKNDIAREELEILAVVKENPGINRGALAKRVKSKLGSNKSLAHLSYLLHRLGNSGKLRKVGARRNATYQAA